MATPEMIEQVRQACISRLFSGRDNVSWEEIGEALMSMDAAAEAGLWGAEKDDLANFLYGEPEMPLGAEKVIEEMTGFRI